MSSLPATQVQTHSPSRREPAQSVTEYKIGEVWSTDAIRPGTISVSGVTTFFPFIDYGSRFVFDYYAVSKEITEYMAILKQRKRPILGARAQGGGFEEKQTLPGANSLSPPRT